MNRLVLIWFTSALLTCLLVPTTSTLHYDKLDEETGCPLNIEHVCRLCTKDQERWGCYCELDDGSELVTASLFTRCPAEIEDPCHNHTCENNATCIRQGLSEHTCGCPVGFAGDRCEDVLPRCTDENIHCPTGECRETNNPLTPVYCQCYDGTRRDPRQNTTCPLSPCYAERNERPICENNGSCQVVNNLPVCQCTPGWAGQNCSKPLKTPLCEERLGVCGEGICQQTLRPPYYACRCGNFSSTFAKTIEDLVKCEESGCYAANPCQNGGTCSNRGKGAFLCQCPNRFAGSKCEKPSPCYNNPCVNNGICQAFNETVYFCECPAYFTGRRCEFVLPEPCRAKNCAPFGECRDVQDIALCYCDDGYHFDGRPCQDPCRGKDCGPGVCTKRANATYEALCSCPSHRKGEACELPNDMCRERTRCGGGYCKPHHGSVQGYSCVCENGLIQATPCPFSKKCPIKDCGEEGICVETDGLSPRSENKPIYYVCQCLHGYITSSNCDALLHTAIPAAANRCGPKGKTYPSRNPNNPIGCWCNNGRHIEEIEENGPTQYCL